MQACTLAAAANLLSNSLPPISVPTAIMLMLNDLPDEILLDILAAVDGLKERCACRLGGYAAVGLAVCKRQL